MIFAAVAV